MQGAADNHTDDLQRKPRGGFTLIELSIVLVIIGLLAGGILVGRDLISAAAVRAQISQIERYRIAANAFRGKYAYLPGDIRDPDASNFGFAARGQYAGEGDGNGILEGVASNAAGQNLGIYQSGETFMFWVDLSQAGLIDGSFITATPATIPASFFTNSGFAPYLPPAKINPGKNYISVYSYGGINYFQITDPSTYFNGQIGVSNGTYALTAQQAYAIDNKMDDASPVSGNVLAYISGTPAFPATYLLWYGFGGVGGTGVSFGSAGPVDPNAGIATPGSTTTCADNNNVTNAPSRYSTMQNSNIPNCMLSFRF